MRTYFDQNRLVNETDRRFHASDIELGGGYVQIVPAVAARVTPQVRVGAWVSAKERSPKPSESNPNEAAAMKCVHCASSAGGYGNGDSATGCTA